MTTAEQRAWVKSMRIQVLIAGLRGMISGAVQDGHVRLIMTRDLDEVYDRAKEIQSALEPKVETAHAYTDT